MAAQPWRAWRSAWRNGGAAEISYEWHQRRYKMKKANHENGGGSSIAAAPSAIMKAQYRQRRK